MDIRTGLDGLRSLLGVPETSASAVSPARSGASEGGSPLSSDRATLSSAGTEVAQSATEAGVRMDKVSAIQAALAAGIYDVPASAVASRLVDAMLASGQ